MGADSGIRLFASDAQRHADGTAGLRVHPDMLTILNGTTGFIKTDEGGQRLRDLYRAGEFML